MVFVLVLFVLLVMMWILFLWRSNNIQLHKYANHFLLVVEPLHRLLRWPSLFAGFQSRLRGSIHLAPPCQLETCTPACRSIRNSCEMTSLPHVFNIVYLPRQSAFHAVPPVHIVVKDVQFWLAGDPAPAFLAFSIRHWLPQYFPYVLSLNCRNSSATTAWSWAVSVGRTQSCLPGISGPTAP